MRGGCWLCASACASTLPCFSCLTPLHPRTHSHPVPDPGYGLHWGYHLSCTARPAQCVHLPGRGFHHRVHVPRRAAGEGLGVATRSSSGKTVRCMAITECRECRTSDEVDTTMPCMHALTPPQDIIDSAGLFSHVRQLVLTHLSSRYMPWSRAVYILQKSHLPDE